MKTVITSNDRSFFSFSELKNYSGLLRYLSLRDVFVRYKQTWVGFGWSIIRPAINILIFGFLSWLVDRSQDPMEKFLSVSAGIIFWQLISNCVTEVSNSLYANGNILTKVYFPKLILPLSSILVCVIDFLIAFALFLIAYIIFKGAPAWQIVFLPVVLFFGLLFCFGFGLLFATASIRYRDVKFILPFIIQILFYASPVFLSSSVILELNIPDWMKTLYQLNPLVSMLNAFKFCFTGVFENYQAFYLMTSVGMIFLLLIVSVKYFLNFERSFADYI